MRAYAKLGLSALAAVFLLAIAVNTAMARNLEVSNQNIRATWSSLEFATELVTIRCKLTLEGSFHARTMAKVARALVGAVTRAIIDTPTCVNGRAVANGPFPWHLTYESFTGTLPNITGVQYLIARFLYEMERPAGLGITCRYGTAADNITGNATLNAERAATNLVPVAGRSIANLLGGTSAFCPARGTLVASASDGLVTLLNSSARITIRLI